MFAIAIVSFDRDSTKWPKCGDKCEIMRSNIYRCYRQ